MTSNHGLLESVLERAGLDCERSSEVEVSGTDPVLPTRLPIGEAAACVLGACGVAVNDLWELRTGRRQQARVEVRAAAAALLSFALLRGGSSELRRLQGPTTALYRARDGGWVHLHGGFAHLRDGLLELLGCEDDAVQIAGAVARWDAQALEDALAERGLCGALARSAEDWLAHPQGQALAACPLLDVERIAPGPPEPLPPGDRPLAGVRVLDLTRVLAGPTCARTLAEHGADVLRVQAPHLASVPPFVFDTGHGKLSTHLDLREAGAVAELLALVRTGDVFSEGYRAGSLARRGFGAEELAAIRPGIVVVSIDCYGHTGPWRERRGWEQLAQTVTGMAVEQGGAEAPRLVPAAATDYTTGYLGALGAMVALARRAREGGSYRVRVSLSRTAMWLLGLERVDGAPAGFDETWLGRYRQTTATPDGPVEHLGPVLELSETPPHWSRASAPPGTHPPAWPPR
jgi:crotonobetainyl-CoA:carnitine CoA-transferase CaiB-like acyl-CoA transferase